MLARITPEPYLRMMNHVRSQLYILWDVKRIQLDEHFCGTEQEMSTWFETFCVTFCFFTETILYIYRQKIHNFTLNVAYGM